MSCPRRWSELSHAPFSRRLGMLETAKAATLRMRFSRRLREAELAAPRVPAEATEFPIGSLVYFYREQKVIPKMDASGHRQPGKRRTLALRKWHGPAMIIGHESNTGIYLGYRGGVTKSCPEAVRACSAMEQLSATEWGAALEQLVNEYGRFGERALGGLQVKETAAPPPPGAGRRRKRGYAEAAAEPPLMFVVPASSPEASRSASSRSGISGPSSPATRAVWSPSATQHWGTSPSKGRLAPERKVRSQAGFLIFLADASLVAGDRGRMSLLDFKSFGLRRICRSSYVAETYAVEEVLDMVLVCRGMMKEVTGREPPVVCVVDARDTYDRCTVDTKPSHGAVKSLAYTVAGLRQVLRLPGVSLKWTHTENMLADALTKDSRELAQHLRSTLSRAEWAVKYVPGLTKACKRDAVRAHLELCRQDASSEAASVAATPSTTARRRMRR